jgi:hypothetical protein
VSRSAMEPMGTPLDTDYALQCRRRYEAADDNPDQASAPDQIYWAGLPVNLDLVFSREQRDKVYLQHLMRKRGSQLRRRLQHSA